MRTKYRRLYTLKFKNLYRELLKFWFMTMFVGVPVKNPHDNGGDEIGCQDADPH
jgi:hypothetical protein